MNNFDKQLELSTSESSGSSLWTKPKSKTRRWIENDSAIVVFLIVSGLFGLYYIPKTPFANTSSSSLSGAFSQPSTANEVVKNLEPSHPVSASTLINGPLEVGASVQFSIPEAQSGWTYYLTIGDAAPIRVKAPFTNYTFTEAGSYSLELTAKQKGHFELLEVRNIVIAPSLTPTTASSQQKLTPF